MYIFFRLRGIYYFLTHFGKRERQYSAARAAVKAANFGAPERSKMILSICCSSLILNAKVHNSSAHPLIFYPAPLAYHVTFHHVYRLRESNMIGKMDRIGMG